MNTSKDQLERLLRGAAEARQASGVEPVAGPSAAWLMARVQHRDSISPMVFRVFRRGLATACLLLLATGFVATREIREHRNSVMSLADAAKSQFVHEFLP